ncbi:MAG: substrate-binding domain-containing protein [Clostridiales bacterium]|nr:substrate-binding domain-containing protein [Clostridiales bacterium]
MKSTHIFTRIMACVLAIVMLSALAGCGGNSAPAATQAPAAADAPAATETATEAAPAAQPHKMVLVGQVAGGPFWGPVESAFRNAIAEKGWEGEFWAPTAPSDSANLELCDTALVQGYDVIAVVMNDIVIFEDFLNRAKEAGVLVLAFNCNPGEDVTPAMVGIDSYASGYSQGTKIAEFAKERGLDAIRYYCTCTTLSSVAQQTTKKGVLAALADKFEGEVIELGMVEDKDNAATGEDAMSQLYLNYPEVNTIFCNDAIGAVSAGSFIESKGLQGKVIACGLQLNDEAFERVMNGSWTATSMVDVNWMGNQIVKVADAILNGGEYTYENFPDKVWVCNEQEIAEYKATHAG